jgi:hypothetical protein
LDTVGELSASSAAARAADAVLTVGTVSVLPAALTGVSDWRDLSGQAVPPKSYTEHQPAVA